MRFKSSFVNIFMLYIFVVPITDNTFNFTIKITSTVANKYFSINNS